MTKLYFELVHQDHEKLQINKSIFKTPMVIGSRTFEHGLGTHARSHIRVYSQEPLTRFTAFVGVDNDTVTQTYGPGSVIFIVEAGGKELYRSKVLLGGMEPERIDIDLKGAREVNLLVDPYDFTSADVANWAEAAVMTQTGKTCRLDEMPQDYKHSTARNLFSFQYDGRPSGELLAQLDEGTEKHQAGRGANANRDDLDRSGHRLARSARSHSV